jgi:hypothetical protein
LWRLVESEVPYTWKRGDTLKSIAALTGFSTAKLLQKNGMKSTEEMPQGKKILLPCYAASVWLEPGLTLDTIAQRFAYTLKELIAANGVRTAEELEAQGQVRLTGWNLFYARKGDTLSSLGKLFGLPKGSSRTMNKVYQREPEATFEFEAVAVPTEEFRAKNAKRF